MSWRRPRRARGPRSPRPSAPGTQLAGLLDRTLNAQILALDSFAKFTQAIAPAAGDLNNLNAQINAGLPSFNAEEADYENLLNTLIPFSNRLAALLSTYHPDIATILASGDNVSRVLLAQQDTIGQVINGAYHYFQKIAEGASGLNKLPDGSTYAYFNTFILFSDVNSLVCNLIAPPTGGMSFLAADPAGAGRERAPPSTARPSCRPSTRSRASSTPTPAPTRRRRSALADVRRPTARPSAAANQAYGIIGQPDTVHADHPRRHHQPASRGARREAAAPLPDVGVQVRPLRARLPRPAGRAGREDRQHLALQQPPHHRRAADRRDRPGQRATPSTSPASRSARSRASACSTGTRSSP